MPSPTAMAVCLKVPYCGAAVPWHRDPITAEWGTVFNLSLYLDESTVDNGCLEFVPGSHRDGRPLEPLDETLLRPLEARRGDALIHDVGVIHGSRPNRSSSLRRALVVEFQKA